MMSINEEDEQAPLLGPQENVIQSNSSAENSTSTVISEHTPKTPWRAIILGQIASVLICLSGVTSVLLTERKLQIPSVQNLASYMLIALWYSTRLALRPDSDNFLGIMKSRGWKYLIITVADVLGNYFVVKAYQLTSLTSVQLLDCFSIPTVLILSYVFLKTRYGHFQYLGVFLAVLGIGCVVWADVQSGRLESTQPVLGDILCLVGAFMYGASNVAQEFFVKKFDPEEFLGCVGFFGCFIAGVQTIIIETDVPISLWTWEATILLGSFAVIQFVFYSLVARVIAMSNSVALNLSILSADFYSLLVGVFLFQYGFNVLYLLSFILVVGAVGIFSLKPATIIHHHFEHLSDTNQDEEDVASSSRAPLNSD